MTVALSKQSSAAFVLGAVVSALIGMAVEASASRVGKLFMGKIPLTDAFTTIGSKLVVFDGDSDKFTDLTVFYCDSRHGSEETANLIAETVKSAVLANKLVVGEVAIHPVGLKAIGKKAFRERITVIFDHKRGEAELAGSLIGLVDGVDNLNPVQIIPNSVDSDPTPHRVSIVSC